MYIYLHEQTASKEGLENTTSVSANVPNPNVLQNQNGDASSSSVSADQVPNVLQNQNQQDIEMSNPDQQYSFFKDEGILNQKINKTVTFD